MAASAADIRSALSIAGPSTSSASRAPVKKQASQSLRKPEGISRELYSLIGPSAPSLAAQLAKPRLKQKPNLGGGGKVKWEWRNFRNGARTDTLELGHWVKATTDPEADYPFAKYNVQPISYTWSQDEYSRYLEDTDWTKEETEYLFNLVRDYDLRWYVIHDRYVSPTGRERSIEDLKDRYFSVCRKLVRNRAWAGDETSRNQLLNSFQYDKEREQLRKRYVMSLESRTPEQITEEEALYLEVKRLEQNERRFKKEREDLLRTIAGIESGLPDITDDDASASLSLDAKKRKNKGLDLDIPPTPILTAPVMKRPSSVKSAAYDATHCIIRNEPSSTMPATKAAHAPSYMRSYKLPVPKAAIAPKVTQVLTELEIQHSRLVMPTKDNCALLESLLEATTALVETKKMIDRVDYDIKVMQSQLEIRDTEGEGGDGASVMEGDEGEVIDEDGRAQSVLSTRSARSRKPSRRSMSVSSVDTTVTGSHRATKRQKRS
ncbi:swr1-complex protein 4 [Moniliophthora roreri]|uniref:SWR1-complex protein 4 n=1 Tax=Moniliophthora roreri TaxID=221103 RepID=A0A0W0FQ20_MONRR|nr:swr1-complex protein 4 [Moniliophthora roreri]